MVPDVEPKNPGNDPPGVRSDPAETIHNEVIPLDSAPGPIKEMQERRRRKRRVLPEPPIPTFIMVSPGRYVRAEEAASWSVVTPEGAVKDGAAPENLKTARDSSSAAEVSTPGLGDEDADRESGSSTSSGDGLESGTGTDDVRADGAPSDAQEGVGTAVGPRSGAVYFVETDPQDPIKTMSGGWAGGDPGRPGVGEAHLDFDDPHSVLKDGVVSLQPEGMGDADHAGWPLP
jgi:hypothetical protein